jgi:hypothetical protein
MLNKILTNPQINDSTSMTANSSELNILDGATATTTELNILDGVNANSTHLNLINGLTANSTELNLLDGTSASHLDINAVANFEETVVANTTEVTIKDGAIDFDIASHDGANGLKLGGTLVTSNAAELNKLDGVSTSQADIDAVTNFEETISATTSAVTITDGAIDFDIASHDGTNGLKLGGTLVTSSAAELNILDGVTANSTEINSALDGITANSTELSILNGVTANSTELNILDGLTSSTTELNLLDGVTSTTTELNLLDGLTANSTELNLLDGLTITTAQLQYLQTTSANVVDLSTTQSITNKGIDADNNTITNIDINAIKPTTLVTQAEGIASNDNETTIPTSAAVKDYVDTSSFTNLSADTLTLSSSLSFSGGLVTGSGAEIDYGGTISFNTLTSTINASSISTNAMFGLSITGAETDGSRTEGTYNGVTHTHSASGASSTLNVVVDSNGKPVLTTTAYGTNFAVNDTITVADSQLGSGGAAALVLTVSAVSNTWQSTLPASSSDGTVKVIVMKDRADTDTSDITITRPGWSASASGFVKFGDKGQTCTLQYLGNSTTGRWYTIGTGSGVSGNTVSFS